MKKLFALATLFVAIANGALTVDVHRATSTQGRIVIKGASGPCSIVLHEGSMTGPIHPDVNNVIDLNRVDTVVNSISGARTVLLGQMRSNLALYADTDWFGQVSGCGGTVSFSFRTANPLGDIYPEAPPWSSSTWDHVDWPTIDPTNTGRNKQYPEVKTGVRIMPVFAPEDFSHISSSDEPFKAWSCTGWTNAGNAADSSDSTYATASGTGWCYFYPNQVHTPYQNYSLTENIGVIIRGGNATGTGEDAKFEFAIGTPWGGPETTPFEVTIPSGTNGPVTSGSSTHPNANNAYPSGFPRVPMQGWGTNYRWERAFNVMNGEIATATGGVLSIPYPESKTNRDPGEVLNWGYGHFPKSMRAGGHILLPSKTSDCNAAGTSGTPGLCTMSSYTHGGLVGLVETSVSGSHIPFYALPKAIMVRKKTGTGSAQISFQQRIAFTPSAETSTFDAKCSSIEVEDADGNPGSLCFYPQPGHIVFLGRKGTAIRPIASLYARSAIGMDSASTIYWSASEARTFYVFVGGLLRKAVFNGGADFKNVIWNSDSGRFRISYPASLQPADPAEYITYTLAMSTDIKTQINANFPRFGESGPYGVDWNTSTFVGVNGDIALFFKYPNGSAKDSEGLMAVMHMPTGTVFHVFSSFDLGTPVSFAGVHSPDMSSLASNAITLALHHAKGDAPGMIHDGPHKLDVAYVKRGGAWHANRCLQWPPLTDTGYCGAIPDYDKSCAGLSDDISFGTDPNQCVTMLVRGPYNSNPTAFDRAMHGDSPWHPGDTTKSGSLTLVPGMLFWDPTANNPLGDQDTEKFRVLSVNSTTYLGQSYLEIVARRNAMRDYDCASDGTSAIQPYTPKCQCSQNQMRHANGWSPSMISGHITARGAISVHIVYTNPPSPTYTIVEISDTYSGHTDAGNGVDGSIVLIGRDAVLPLPSLSILNVQPPVVTGFDTHWPRYAGMELPVGGIAQQYIRHTVSVNAPNKNKKYTIDVNHVNPGYGSSGNNLGNGFLQSGKTFTLVGGNVWKISVLNGADPLGSINLKTQTMIGYVGQRYLRDVSGPNSDIASATDFSVCFARRTNECAFGSVPFSSDPVAYIKASSVSKFTTLVGNPGSEYPLYEMCGTGGDAFDVPCVMSLPPGAGYVRQYDTSQYNDGRNTRILSSLFRFPGAHYPFLGAKMDSTGTFVITGPGGNFLGGREIPWALYPPPYPDTTYTPPDYGGIKIKIPYMSGATHGRVMWGYDPQMRCVTSLSDPSTFSGRDEPCVTDTAAPEGWAFTGDTLTPTACGTSAGCEVEVKARRNRMVFTKIQYLNSGSVIATKDVVVYTAP